ncbi:10767_t:CDS:2 [Diversispora eburnea]|uniref:10767_t:CDS:1 n=1 Tax=Diversispora eburnea TaxID=1213867 RepID=A0A9N9F9M2_9GLOM|nr:10767_t:CDS:2 [Diversispora eburnea]
MKDNQGIKETLQMNHQTKNKIRKHWQQQLFSSSSNASNDNEQTDPLNRNEYKKLEKVIDALIETIVPNKTKQAKEAVTNIINSSLSRKSKELIKFLINEYFNRFNNIIPILDRQKFKNVSKDGSKTSELLLNSVLAISASRYSDDPAIQKSQDKPGGIFYDAAKKLLDSMYHIPKLETVQALLLLCHSESSATRADSAYMFLGMAVQMSNNLHLERDEACCRPEGEEERRRVFYCLYCCNRWVSFILGKPSGIEDINVDIPLPTLVSFELSTRSFFIAWIKISRILGEIWKFGYSSKPKASHSNWTYHATDQKSTLRQIRSALANWLKELPDELQYQYLPNTDPRSLIQLTRFSAFAGYINILFHTCIILLHQPYLTQEYEDPKIEMQKQGQSRPIKTCLTAAITITDIARTTRKFDKNSFINFQYIIYGVMQSSILEMVVMNASKEYESLAKKSLNDAIEELRFISENSSYISMREIIAELQGVMMIANSKPSDIVIPFPLVLQILEYNKAGGNFMNNDSTANISEEESKFENSLKVEYPLSTTATTITTNASSTITSSNTIAASTDTVTNVTTNHSNEPISTPSNPSNIYMMAPTNLFNPQDQSSLQFHHQIQPNLDSDPWDNEYFMNDGLYGFVNTHHVSESNSTDSNEFQFEL